MNMVWMAAEHGMRLGISGACLIRISVFLAFVAAVIFLLFDVLMRSFLYNIPINSVIICGFITGIVFIYSRLFLMGSEYAKLKNFDKLTRQDVQDFHLLRPMTLYVSKSNKMVSHAKLQTILSSVEKRVEDASSFPRYVTGLLIFLGLLGTFWGLSHTIGNVASIIDNLGLEETGAAESFLKLKDSLKIPLSGMGIAFGCSLFGLSSSLIVGFLNMNLRRASDKFLDAVEEWLTRYTASFDVIDNYQNFHGPVFSMGLLEKTVEMIYAFQNQLNDLDGNRTSIMTLQRDVSQKIAKLTDAVAMHQDAVKAITRNQMELHELVVTNSHGKNDEVWTEMLRKLDSIEGLMNGLIQGSSTNKDQIIDSLGKELRLVSKTISSMAQDYQ
ncbi:MAG: hypothetical protein LBJ69_00820 [Holosporales bacterium]|jgi:hypothetical protein|nr:hypothetical protein [Holosporales bacterium]